MTVARTLLKAPFANVEVSTLYYSGTMEDLCLKDPLYELIIGNIARSRDSDDLDETWCVKAAAITRSQSRISTEGKPLRVAEVTDKLAITKDRLTQLQEKESSLSNYIKKKAPLVRNGNKLLM